MTNNKQNMKFALVIISMVTTSLLQGFSGQINSETGTIQFDVNFDNQTEAVLSDSGFGLGTTAPSANLHVAGNSIISESLSIGSNSSTGSNLSVQGTWGFSILDVSDNAELTQTSFVLADTSNGNIFLQLPSVEDSQDRLITIKKTSLEHELTLTGGMIEGASSAKITSGGNAYPSIELINSDSTWYILGGQELDLLETQSKIFHAKLDEVNGSSAPIDSVSGLEGVYKEMSAANIGVAGNIGLAVDFDGGSAGNSTGDFIKFSPTSSSADSLFDLQVFTIAASVNLRGLGETDPDTNVIIKRGNSQELNYRISTDSSDNVRSVIRDIGATSNFNSMYSTTPIPRNSWTHLTLTYDGQEQKLYINGVLNSTDTTTGQPLVSGATELLIGGSSASQQNFNGKIDDIRIYNYSFSDNEVLQLYQGNID
jgi:hypothetical protein